jgi:hypothetical protein
MSQLQLFSRSEVAAMRDRSGSRKYSAERDEFRRDHQRRRRWGLGRRHALKRCRLRGCSAECAAIGLHEHDEGVPPLIWPAGATRLPQSSRPEAEGDVPADSINPADQAVLPGQAEAEAVTAENATRAEPSYPAVTADQARSTGHGERAGKGVAEAHAEPADHTEDAGRAEAGRRVESLQYHRRRPIRDSGLAATGPTAAGTGTPRATRTPHSRPGPGECGRARNNKPDNARPPPGRRARKMDFKQEPRNHSVQRTHAFTSAEADNRPRLRRAVGWTAGAGVSQLRILRERLLSACDG